MVNIGIGTAGLAAFLGYLVDFIGIILLMFVIIIMGKILYRPKEEPVVDLGSIEIPTGIEGKKAAVILAALAQEAGWGNVAINARSVEKAAIDPKTVAAIVAVLGANGEA